MRISEQKRKQLCRLIAEGENLDLQDQDAFCRWVHTSYKALWFNPSQQRAFDEYCRSSFDFCAMRIFVGVWILRLSLEESTSESRDQRNRLISTVRAPRCPKKGGSGYQRKK